VSHAGVSVTNTAIPSTPATAAAKTLPSLGVRASSGRLLAHLRQPVTAPFSMLGVTWAHESTPASLSVHVRTQRDGRWTPWTALDTDADGGPLTTADDSAFRDGTEPVWVGDATGVEVAILGSTAPADLEVSMIDPGSSPPGLGAAQKASATSGVGRPGSFPRMPKVITRKQWGADESLGDTCWDPRYGRTFKAVVVHHTAGSNDYERSESAALVRGILAYHTQSRGWCDIGYNFLIDRYGRVFEGRAGGMRRAVRGAHAGDYNVNTTGISLMGNFDIAYPTKAMKQSLIRMIAWRLGTAYHGPYGKPFIFDRKISRISGHRDVMPTSCPGQHVYDWLPRLRHLVAERLDGYHSRIEKAWSNSGGKAGALGPVKVGEMGGGGGHHTTFAHGRIYVSRAGVRTLYDGPVLRRYLKSGETRGILGYPRTTTWSAGHDRGRAAEFDGGRIYWSKKTGAKLLRRGAVLKKYVNLNAASGRLGFPKTGVTDISGGSRARFQHGTITYDKSTGEVAVEYR
jgi:uncharacterized protein with LGFP repeats